MGSGKSIMADQGGRRSASRSSTGPGVDDHRLLGYAQSGAKAPAHSGGAIHDHPIEPVGQLLHHPAGLHGAYRLAAGSGRR